MRAMQQAAANKKYDLQKWKYAELRDAINTSCGEYGWLLGLNRSVFRAFFVVDKSCLSWKFNVSILDGF